jgi:ribosomal protein L7/L12
MNITFTPARTVAEATHYLHLRDSLVFPVGEYADRYPNADAVLPMVLSVQVEQPTVQVEQPTVPKRAASYYDAIDMMYSPDAWALQAYAEAGKKINAIKGLRDYAKVKGFSTLGLKDAKEAVETYMSEQAQAQRQAPPGVDYSYTGPRPGGVHWDDDYDAEVEAQYAEQDD